MGEEYVARIIVFAGMVHGIAVFFFFMDAIAHGKAGHADAATEHAEAGLGHLLEVKF
jgi:hypothetical protein